MGLIDGLFGLLFGGGRNVIRETAEVFRVNAESDASREAAYRAAALAQVRYEAVSCPNCGGSLDLAAPDKTLRVTCPYCDTVLDANQGH